ncbi:CD1B2 protein, partial [Alectura lathami]|nr:CD1B2 protein [Alectura lathami]
MRPGCLLLFLVFLLLRTWAEPETPCHLPTESQLLQIFQTFFLVNASFTEVHGVCLLGDVLISALDPRSWNIRIFQPWVHQAISEADMGNLLSSSVLGLRNVIRFIHEMASMTRVDYPLAIQVRGGAELYSNGTSQAFVVLGEGGSDLVMYEQGREHWIPQQPTLLAREMSRSLSRLRSVSGFLEHILCITVPSCIRSLSKYGRADLERQEPPVATVFTRTAGPAQLLLICRVTGFYPRPVTVTWLRDGQEVPPGPALSTGAVLPNADLTYQLRSTLLVAPRDGHSYACRVQHCSLGDRSLLIPWENPTVSITVSIAVVVVLLLAVIAAGGVWWWRCR